MRRCTRPDSDGAGDADGRGAAAHVRCSVWAAAAMRVAARGYGAGGRTRRVSRTCCGCWWAKRTMRRLSGADRVPEAEESIAVIETVIDDSTPQLLAYVSELLLEAGAWDVYRAAVQMKKGARACR